LPRCSVIRGAAAEALLTRPAGLSGLLGAGGSVHTTVAGSCHGLVNRRGVLGSWPSTVGCAFRTVPRCCGGRPGRADLGRRQPETVPVRLSLLQLKYGLLRISDRAYGAGHEGGRRRGDAGVHERV
jgi:hypothetical protein